MNTVVMARRVDWSTVSRTALKAAAAFWFVVTAAGQLLFAASVAVSFGHAALGGRWDAFNRLMAHGHDPADPVGNGVVGLHLAAAVLVMLAGLVQLVPQVRARFPAFHRLNGRVYLATVLAASVAGLYLVWVRGSVGDLPQHLGLSLDALLVIGCGAMALRTARARDFVAHRRWALRLFIVASAVWFFRVGLMLWLAANGGPAGFDPATFAGPFLTFLAFAQSLVPLALLEVYLRARDRWNAPRRLATAAGLFVVTLAMGAGIAAAATAAWLPRLDVRSDRVTDVVETTMKTQGVAAGVERFRQLRAQGFPGLYESEADNNTLGYQFLRSRQPDRAIAILELNVETHPQSANAYDSLGEAYVAGGRRERAIESYEKALAINPATKSAIAALKALGRPPAE